MNDAQRELLDELRTIVRKVEQRLRPEGPVAADANKEVIELLEDLLHSARRGEIVGVAYVTVSRQHKIVTGGAGERVLASPPPEAHTP